MKTFCIILVIFVLMIGLILYNALYINRLSFALSERLDAMPDVGDAACVPRARELLDFWNSHTKLVGLSVCYPTLDRLTEQAVTLLACAECNDLYGFRAALALLYDSVGDLRRLENPFS